MLPAKNLDAPSVQRQKVLLVGAERSIQSLVSTLLATMATVCTMASGKEETPAILEREVFDAVLLDCGGSDSGADEFIPRTRQIRPSGVITIIRSARRVSSGIRACGEHKP